MAASTLSDALELLPDWRGCLSSQICSESLTALLLPADAQKQQIDLSHQQIQQIQHSQHHQHQYHQYQQHQYHHLSRTTSNTTPRTPSYLRASNNATTPSPLFSPRRSDSLLKSATRNTTSRNTSNTDLSVSPVALDSLRPSIMLRLTATRGTDFIYCVHATVGVSSVAESNKSEADVKAGLSPESFDRTVVRILNLAAWRRACTRTLQQDRGDGSLGKVVDNVDAMIQSVFDQVAYKVCVFRS
jgi:hypothetical protein